MDRLERTIACKYENGRHYTVHVLLTRVLDEQGKAPDEQVGPLVVVFDGVEELADQGLSHDDGFGAIGDGEALELSLRLTCREHVEQHETQGVRAVVAAALLSNSS